MEFTAELGRVRAEQVGKQQGRAEQQNLRRQQAEETERGQQSNQVSQARRLGGNLPDQGRLREEALHDREWRIAQRAVARKVDRLLHPVDRRGVVRNDDKGCQREPGQAEEHDQKPGRRRGEAWAVSRLYLPESQPGMDALAAGPRQPGCDEHVQPQHECQQRGLFFDAQQEQAGQDEASPVTALATPEGEQNRRGGEGDGVKFGQVGRLQRGEEQVSQREAEGQPGRQPPGRGSQNRPGQGKKDQGAAAQRRRLQDQQGAHVVPQIEDQRDGQENRLHMVGQARAHEVVFDLLHKTALACIPNRQVHLPQVGHVGVQRCVRTDRENGKANDIEQEQQEHGQALAVSGQPARAGGPSRPPAWLSHLAGARVRRIPAHDPAPAPGHQRAPHFADHHPQAGDDGDDGGQRRGEKALQEEDEHAFAHAQPTWREQAEVAQDVGGGVASHQPRRLCQGDRGQAAHQGAEAEAKAEPHQAVGEQQARQVSDGEGDAQGRPFEPAQRAVQHRLQHARMEEDQAQRRQPEGGAQTIKPGAMTGQGKVDGGQEQPGQGGDGLVQRDAGKGYGARDTELSHHFAHAQKLPDIARDVADDVGQEPDAGRVAVRQRAAQPPQDEAPLIEFQQPGQPEQEQGQQQPANLDLPGIGLQLPPLGGDQGDEKADSQDKDASLQPGAQARQQPGPRRFRGRRQETRFRG